LCLVDHFTYSLFKRCHSQQSEPEHEADSKITCNDNDSDILLGNRFFTDQNRLIFALGNQSVLPVGAGSHRQSAPVIG
jgi:hypothetical protein